MLCVVIESGRRFFVEYELRGEVTYFVGKCVIMIMVTMVVGRSLKWSASLVCNTIPKLVIMVMMMMVADFASQHTTTPVTLDWDTAHTQPCYQGDVTTQNNWPWYPQYPPYNHFRP